ncbi:hypothetical protein AAFF_G00252600 [Aldrovandia affinis]|uniref:Uncharacterized protein n=1 Tax=Aldrovandia affinis TaxID=143900 RepID=A0AAD7SU23_9TELE|nr:hypothetical protein AAFF_G00252600 [Aldrovandia affinis]
MAFPWTCDLHTHPFPGLSPAQGGAHLCDNGRQVAERTLKCWFRSSPGDSRALNCAAKETAVSCVSGISRRPSDDRAEISWRGRRPCRVQACRRTQAEPLKCF